MSKPGHGAAAPFIVVFYYEGHELRARIRDVGTQEQRVLRNAAALRELMLSAWSKAEEALFE